MRSVRPMPPNAARRRRPSRVNPLAAFNAGCRRPGRTEKPAAFGVPAAAWRGRPGRIIERRGGGAAPNPVPPPPGAAGLAGSARPAAQTRRPGGVR